jgi:hypothetical protein
MNKLFIFLLAVLILPGCGHEETYPDVPTLEFKSMVFGDENNLKTFTLTTTFTDGDGDIGYYQDRPNDPQFDDTLSPYYYNYVIELQVSRNGVWVDTIITYRIIDYKVDTIDEDNDTTYAQYNDLISTRLPYSTQDGQNKGLKGDIDKTGYLPFPIADTIRYRAYIYDRALNKSNEVYTPAYFIRNP